MSKSGHVDFKIRKLLTYSPGATCPYSLAVNTPRLLRIVDEDLGKICKELTASDLIERFLSSL